MGDFAARGGWWVVAQFALMAATIGAGFAPPGWPGSSDKWLAVAGAVLALAGALLAYFAAHELGRALTPFPEPARRAALTERGPYRLVRHPIYAGGLLFFAGYALFSGPLALAGTVLLALLWARKAIVEERRLRARFEGYEAYAERVPWRLLTGVW